MGQRRFPVVGNTDVDYNIERDGGRAGLVPLDVGVGANVEAASIYVYTYQTFTSGGAATLAIAVDGTIITSVITIASFTAGSVTFMPTLMQMGGPGIIQLSIGVANLTAGRCNILIDTHLVAPF